MRNRFVTFLADDMHLCVGLICGCACVWSVMYICVSVCVCVCVCVLSHQAGMEARRRALEAALDDLKAYLTADTGQVAIFGECVTTYARIAPYMHA